jgi:hypothetical protein
MDIDGDGGRREFGLCGQRRGTESDKGTAANSLSGYHAPGSKKILACLRPWSTSMRISKDMGRPTLDEVGVYRGSRGGVVLANCVAVAVHYEEVVTPQRESCGALTTLIVIS